MAVDHVSNVTDIDDKIIARANLDRCPAAEIANRYEAEWWDAMDVLGCLRPTETPHATDYIPEMVELIVDLARRGAAYETSDGVYFNVSAVSDYGMLAHQKLGSMRSGTRIGVKKEKRSPLDFAVWKKAKPDEPSWPSPWGLGRPGWHTECVVMSLALLGEDFDLHSGGQDLIFPHHENERAQAVADGKVFARHWMHHGMVEAQGGEKMSKSLGNVWLLSDFFEQIGDPRAYRLLVLQAHYRAPIEVNATTLSDAKSALGRLDALCTRLGEGDIGQDVGSDAEVKSSFVSRMQDDLDTPGATAVLFDAIRRANLAFDERESSRGAQLARAVLECFGAVGLEAAGEAEIPESIRDLGRRRDLARAQRDFATADSLRDEVTALGYVVEDTAGGTRIRR
jgi:cysteinyl-tRNA synthetase